MNPHPTDLLNNIEFIPSIYATKCFHFATKFLYLIRPFKTRGFNRIGSESLLFLYLPVVTGIPRVPSGQRNNEGRLRSRS